MQPRYPDSVTETLLWRAHVCAASISCFELFSVSAGKRSSSAHGKDARLHTPHPFNMFKPMRRRRHSLFLLPALFATSSVGLIEVVMPLSLRRENLQCPHPYNTRRAQGSRPFSPPLVPALFSVCMLFLALSWLISFSRTCSPFYPEDFSFPCFTFLDRERVNYVGLSVFVLFFFLILTYS